MNEGQNNFNEELNTSVDTSINDIPAPMPTEVEIPVTPVEEPVMPSINDPIPPVAPVITEPTPVATSVDTGNKKGNKGLIIIIIILAALLLGAIGYIIYSNGWLGGKDTEPTSKETTEKKDCEEKETKKDIDDDMLELAVKFALIKNVGVDTKGCDFRDDDNAKWAEGHKILKSELKDNKINVYLLATLGTYSITNGVRKDICGEAGPILLTFDKDYNFISYKQPADGEGYTESLKELFPTDIIDEALNYNFKDTFYETQINSYLK